MTQSTTGDSGTVEPGQSWAYRARQTDELVQVKVLRRGTQRPARALVRFTDDEFEGREEWVPPARLKVRWENVAGYRAREERWNRIDAVGLPLDDPRDDAAETVLDLLFPEEELSIGYRESGAIHISDPVGLAGRLGLEADQVTGHPDAFVEDNVLIAPWPVTELIVTTAARQKPAPILDYVANEERKAQYEAIHGRWSRGGRRSNDYYFEPEHCIRFDDDYSRPPPANCSAHGAVPKPLIASTNWSNFARRSAAWVTSPSQRSTRCGQQVMRSKHPGCNVNSALRWRCFSTPLPLTNRVETRRSGHRA